MDQTSTIPPLSLTPALEPPPGHIPNFDNPENFHGAIIATIAVCLTLVTFMTGVRMYTKLIISKSHGWDDYTNVIGWLGFIGFCTLALLGIRYGEGVHLWDINVPNAIQGAKLVVVLGVYYSFLIFIVKLSILLQYLNIFVPGRQGPLYYITLFLIWTNLIFYLVMGFCVLFQCIPREKIWDPLVPGKCLNFTVLLGVSSIFNVISDFSILALPLVSTWRLQMATKHKIRVTVVFALAFFACISSLMRTIRTFSAGKTLDSTWGLAELYLWSVAEITSGLICVSLPVLPQFFRHSITNISKKWLSISQRKSSTQGTPTHRPYVAPNKPKVKPSSGVWHDLRDIRTSGNAPYVQFDKSETDALATRGASTDDFREGEKGPPSTPSGKGSGTEAWDGPIVRQTDLESGASVDDLQSIRYPR
ncbi:hypothetical protein MMC22_005459 [Lobaria immixta]|nr:hypothetical protein [Lobaria immixta]